MPIVIKRAEKRLQVKCLWCEGMSRKFEWDNEDAMIRHVLSEGWDIVTRTRHSGDDFITWPDFRCHECRIGHLIKNAEVIEEES